MTSSWSIHIRKQKGYRKIYFEQESNNLDMFMCYFCRSAIDLTAALKSDSLEIHHLDKNHENCDINNLVAVHKGCHLSYHKHEEWFTRTGCGSPETVQLRNDRSRMNQTGAWDLNWSAKGNAAQKERGTGVYDPEFQDYVHEINRANGLVFGTLRCNIGTARKVQPPVKKRAWDFMILKFELLHAKKPTPRTRQMLRDFGAQVCSINLVFVVEKLQVLYDISVKSAD